MTPEQAEKALVDWRRTSDSRDRLVHAARAAGLSKNRIHVLTGIHRGTIDKILEKQMITVTDVNTTETATIERADFAAVVTTWFEDAPAEIVEQIAEVQRQLDAGEFIEGSAVGSLGLEIR